MDTLEIALIDKEISEALNEDEQYIVLTEQEKQKVLDRLNDMLHHNIYRIE